MEAECTLCGLPTPDSAHTASDVRGAFCCRGCLDVARSLEDVEDVGRDDLEARAAAGAEDSETAGPDGARTADQEAPDDELARAFLEVDGMHCSTCEAFVSLRGESEDGIGTVEASYATDTARVSYDPERIDPADLPAAVSGYGYTARHRDESASASSPRRDDELGRLVAGVFLAMLVMPWYIFFLYPSYVGLESGILAADRTAAFGLYFPMVMVAALTTIVVCYSGWPILRGGYVSLRTRRPNMDLLLSVAILAASGYSTVTLLSGGTHLYYDVSIAIVLVVTAGGYYEGTLKRRATGRLSDLITTRVTEATRLTEDGSTETIPVDAIEPGDDVVVRPGERVPIDGTVREGVAAVDEAVLTGESLPVTKRPGDTVIGGSVVTDDALVVRVDDAAESTLDRITSLLWSVQSTRPGVQRFADRLATVFVPLVLLLGAGVAGWHLAVGNGTAAALLAGLTVLVAACPCAMGLATPLAIAGGLRDALERGIVVTNGTLFEAAPAVDTIVFDKTGTLTTGEMRVQRVVGDGDALAPAAAVERRSSHPVGEAIVDHARETAAGETGARGEARVTDGGDVERVEERTGSAESPAADTPAEPTAVDAPASDVANFERHPGEGVSGEVDGERVVVGTPALVERRCGPLPDRLESAVADARASGNVPAVIGRGDRAAAVAIVGDRDRTEWEDALAAFDEQSVIVLSGDGESAAARFRDHPAVDRVFAGVPPDGKTATIRRLGAAGTVAMVGDGTNDAPALAAADVGIAFGGTARAGEAADVAILDGRLTDVPAVFDLARATRRRIRENVAWALCYNAVALPLAVASVLNPLFAALAMAGSSILVVTNSRRRLLAPDED
ncbi:heavy metal translocating P-type ATPase [Halovivax limisalsi]|uniref:heavy metal translocating P-type ATPase n=1 Tax=Halovivax limisalsi TaxID=1453760 RepID=UPI001FFCBF1B|nr:heavy metal translocating P-type ATPase [Halovivax limisalsi]